MRIKNTVLKADAMLKKINERYDMQAANAMDIKQAYGGNLESIFCAFRFGYMQGMKAAKAESKKEGTSGEKLVHSDSEKQG